MYTYVVCLSVCVCVITYYLLRDVRVRRYELTDPVAEIDGLRYSSRYTYVRANTYYTASIPEFRMSSLCTHNTAAAAPLPWLAQIQQVYPSTTTTDIAAVCTTSTSTTSTILLVRIDVPLLASLVPVSYTHLTLPTIYSV